MHAAMIKAFGEPKEVLELVDGPEPTPPGAGEVLIGVEYAPINMNDLYAIQGAFPVRPSLPSVVGNEGVSRVLAVGSDVEHRFTARRPSTNVPDEAAFNTAAPYDRIAPVQRLPSCVGSGA
jgi:NADPH:quinone reductase-like Zn-dependent oxidoreductase